MNIRYKLKTRKAVYPLKIFSQFYIRNLAASWVIFLLSHVRPTAQIADPCFKSKTQAYFLFDFELQSRCTYKVRIFIRFTPAVCVFYNLALLMR